MRCPGTHEKFVYPPETLHRNWSLIGNAPPVFCRDGITKEILYNGDRMLVLARPGAKKPETKIVAVLPDVGRLLEKAEDRYRQLGGEARSSTTAEGRTLDRALLLMIRQAIAFWYSEAEKWENVRNLGSEGSSGAGRYFEVNGWPRRIEKEWQMLNYNIHNGRPWSLGLTGAELVTGVDGKAPSRFLEGSQIRSQVTFEDVTNCDLDEDDSGELRPFYPTPTPEISTPMAPNVNVVQDIIDEIEVDLDQLEGESVPRTTVYEWLSKLRELLSNPTTTAGRDSELSPTRIPPLRVDMSDRPDGNKGSMINVQSTASQPRDDRRKRDRIDEEITPQDVGSTKKPKSSHLSNPQLQTGQQANPLPPQLDPKISYTVPVVSCQPVVSKVVDRKEALLQWQKIIWQIYDCMRALNALSLFKLLVSILEERVTEAPYLKFADVGNADLDITFVEKAEKWGRDALTFSWEGKPDGIHTVQRFLNMLDRIKIKGGITDP